MYTDKVMDHFEHPRNVGELENPSGMGTVGNPKCGDIMRIYLDIDENQIIRDVKFKTFGCGAAVATSSMATELVKGRTVQEAMAVTNKAVMDCRRLRYTVLYWQRRQSMQPSGIMHRKTVLPSRDLRSPRIILRKRKKRKTIEQEGCSRHVRRS